MDMFRQVHAVDGHPKLFLNDYGIVVNANKAVVGIYVEKIDCTFKPFQCRMFKLLRSFPHLFSISRSYNHIIYSSVENSLDTEQLSSLRNQLISIYIVFKTGYIPVQRGSG